MKSPYTFEELRDMGFLLKEGYIGEELCYLVQPPHIAHEWTKDTLIYRSSIWNSDLQLVSAGFKKFFNYNEAIDVVPNPTDEDIVNGSILEKMDGSLLILSKYKGELIHRTRGTFNAENLSNGREIALLKNKYPKLFKSKLLAEGCSILLEWTTPSNRIVIDYGDEPELRLVGVIDHSDYDMFHQNSIDLLAWEWDVKRPKRFTFDNIGEMLSTIKELEGEEGCVVYYHDEQYQSKVKADEYLKLHRFKANATWKNVLGMFLEGEYNSIEEYRDHLVKTFDYECFTMVECFLPRIFSEWNKLQTRLNEIKDDVLKHKELVSTRKEMAEYIIGKYDGLFKSCAFIMLDGNHISDDVYNKMMLEALQPYMD